MLGCPPAYLKGVVKKYYIFSHFCVYKRPSVPVSVLMVVLVNLMGSDTLRERPPLVLIGDFNIDLMPAKECPTSSTFTTLLHDYGLHQMIRDATTINGSKIDHIWTKSESRQFVAPHSDHSYICFRSLR